MNLFGAVTILVVVIGTVLGAYLCDFALGNRVTQLQWLLISIAGLISGYLSLKIYKWLLRVMDERAKCKQRHTK